MPETLAGPTKLVSRAAIPRRNTSRSSMPCSICKAARLPTDDRMARDAGLREPSYVSSNRVPQGHEESELRRAATELWC
jgi:hypothetical protein